MLNNIEKKLFVAATNQNVGKTTTSLGLVQAFKQLSASVGFIKPVGRRHVTVNDHTVDEDSLLIFNSCELQCNFRDLTPVVVSRDFTRRYLDNPKAMQSRLEDSILKSFTAVSKDKDVVVVEGTGHAGVGSIFGLSNARVAKLLDAKVIMVTLGGIGKPVDEVAVNKSLFEKEGVSIVGIVVNKVMPDKLEQTRKYLSMAFDGCGIPLLGVIPYTPRLTWPTVTQVVEAVNAEILNGRERLENPIADIIIGAMTPQNAVNYVKDKTLLIVPGDRDDVIYAVVTKELLHDDIELSGIVLTGGLEPQEQTLKLLCRTQIPVLITQLQTYEATSRIRDIVVKITISDQEKIELATKLVREYVELDRLWKLLE